MAGQRCLVAMLGGLGMLIPVESAVGVGMDAQRIVVRRCAAALPPEMSPFFESRVADLEERVIEPDGVWRRDRKLRSRVAWDHLWMDVKARNGSMSARLAAAEAFPRREREARDLFKSMGFKRQGGRLPWAIADLHAELVCAFEQRDDGEIVRVTGCLAHFAWAASQPFSVTTNHDGRGTGNLYLGELTMGDPYFPHQSVHFRAFGEMVRRYRNRYLEQVQVRPIDLRPIADPLDACFHHMVGSLARAEDLLTADRELTERLGAKDGAALLERVDEYYELLDDRCGELVVERLRSAAMLAANLVAGAWERAGRPVLSDLGSPAPGAPAAPRESPGQAAREAPTTAETPGSISYVGSKKSKVFHRSDCPHASRISPSNLVHYRSVQEAEQQGKRPCRVCKPE